MTIKPGYTRVSEILSQWDHFGAIDKEVLKNKAKLGSLVHEAISAYEDHLSLPLDEKADGYYQSFLKWREKVDCEFVASELRLYCDKLKITGAVDAIVKFPGDDSLIIIDYKTSAVASPKRWELQGVFYHYLAFVNGFKVSSRFIFLKLDKKGEYPEMFSYTRSTGLMNVAMSALNTFRFFEKD